MEQQQINDIIEKYKQGIASPVELELLNNWYRDSAYLDAEYPDSEQEVYDRIITRLNSKINPVQRRTKLWPRIAAVAAILLVAGAGIFFYTNTLRHPDTGQGPEIAGVNDIAPGKFGATLTLANGKKIVLSDAKNGELVKESGVNITKTADGRIVYEILKQVQNDENSDKTNTLSTAKGETYQVRLPDGTSIWLNAASTLKYPASFAAHKNRRVELSGEAYFEIAKDKKHPFIVLTEKQEVEVLGTHFNINSYADEASTKTTLLEGSVRVAYAPRHPELVSGPRTSKVTTQVRDPDAGQDDGAVVLKPGEQARVTANNRIRVTDADLAEVTAWKNGDFIFRTEDFKTIMRKVARWYNVDIVFDASAPTNLSLGGVVSRTKNISAVLKIMEATGDVHFKIEGRRITVTK